MLGMHPRSQYGCPARTDVTHGFPAPFQIPSHPTENVAIPLQRQCSWMVWLLPHVGALQLPQAKGGHGIYDNDTGR